MDYMLMTSSEIFLPMHDWSVTRWSVRLARIVENVSFLELRIIYEIFKIFGGVTYVASCITKISGKAWSGQNVIKLPI